MASLWIFSIKPSLKFEIAVVNFQTSSDFNNYVSFNSINQHHSVFSHQANKTIRVSEPVHEISNNVVCATSKASDQPALTRSLMRAFASRLSIL